MRRRSVLRLFALGAAGLAGCAGSDDDRGQPPARPPPAQPTSEPTSDTPEPTIPTPTPSPFVEELQTDIGAVTIEEGDDGTVQASVPVENTVDRTFDADLVVTVEADEEYTTRRRISVPGGMTETFTVTFDVAWAEATADGRQVRLRSIALLRPGAER